MNKITRACAVALVLLAASGALLWQSPDARAWGEAGHKLSGRAAATDLPKEMPKFFRQATAQLEYLNPEPDRWRSRVHVEMNEAFSYDHFVDMEMVPAAAFNAEDRYAYLVALYDAGIKKPETAGLLSFHIVELYQRLRAEFYLWRNAKDKRTRQWIEERIINDAGILGHYVADGANPHHTTIHYNGWDKHTPNPNNYTTDNTFHARFESEYVQTHISINDLLPKMNKTPSVLNNPRADVLQYLRDSNSQVVRLYEIEKRNTYNKNTTAPENKEFAIERLVAGAQMLRNLWWTAWVKSETEN
ncbi:MAG: hypothetical protein QOF02_3411 [Blastocatellia bacterium]|jgi:hypothetical protein|nr:hypothetical protein [Blastocatellia bacterium]